MSKQALQPKANELFAIHKLEVLHLTSDGQGFSEENKHHAESHSQTLKDKKVYTFERNFEPETTETKTASTDTNREALVEEYTKLFDKKPAHNIKADTLQAKINAKKAELAALPVQTETVTATKVEATETDSEDTTADTSNDEEE